MPTLEKCINCTEKCPQADLARKTALGRMYVTNEFVALIQKIERGEIVEVVRCKDCKWLCPGKHYHYCTKHTGLAKVTPDSFCSYGVRWQHED